VVEPGTTDTVVMPSLPPPPPPPPPTIPSLPPPLTPPPLPPGTIALQVGAGPDHLVYLPTDYCTLFGWVSGYSTFTVEWRQISGPTSCLIENPYSLGTNVSHLVKGVYQFEITVSANGLTGMDTCGVTVGTVSLNPNEIIFENQNWSTQGLNGSLLWGSAIVINNIHQFIPVGTVFKTYIKRDSTTVWEELIPGYEQSWYEFFSMNGNLCVWSSYDETDSPEIKLVY
jgi:hypothetical protein